MKEKGSRWIFTVSVLILFAVISISVAYLHSERISSGQASDRMIFPWDPLEWDTLRDSPLIYKSLGDSLENYPFYEPYIKDPASLGFAPDAAYFESVLSLIKVNHVGQYDRAKLLDGCEKELGRLFKEAKIKTTPTLKDYDLEHDFIPKVIQNYGTQMNHGILVLACLEGLLRGLNDPYTNILTPRDYSMLMERLQEKSFGGVGIYIELDSGNNNWLTVIEPIEGTPASKAGVHSGDVIESIGGESTKNITLDEAVAKLRGPKGSHVTLAVRRKGVLKLLTFRIVRDEINVHSITYKVIDGQIGYIRIRMFGTETGQELDKALQAILAPPEQGPQKIKSLILDMRNNGGGYLDAAVEVSSRFLPRNTIVFRRLDRKGKIKDFLSEKCETVKLPLVVLVNRFSASSSEIVAGALKCNKAGTLMGDRTFGKGSVQQLYHLPSESALKLTVSYFLTPEGKIINKKGLKPDISVRMKPNMVGKDKDTQLEEAVSFLRKQKAVTEANH